MVAPDILIMAVYDAYSGANVGIMNMSCQCMRSEASLIIITCIKDEPANFACEDIIIEPNGNRQSIGTLLTTVIGVATVKPLV